MPEITRKRTGDSLRQLFTILMDQPDGMKASVALAALREKVVLSPYEAGFYESGGQRFEKIIRFATVDCVKAGWMTKNKGTWAVTSEGQAAMALHKDGEAFYKEAVKLYHQWKAANSAAGVALPAEDALELLDDDQSAAVTFDQAEEQAWTEIEGHLAAIDPFEFQELVADLLHAMGYHVTWKSPPGKDGGLDLIAFTDPLGTQSPRIKVQVKRQQAKVTSDGLKSFVALIGGQEVGIFVALGGFTKDAEDYARMQAQQRITLIDAERLVELWIEHYRKLSDIARQRLPLAPIYFLAA